MKKNEPVSKIMSTELSTVHPGQKLSDVRALLVEKRFHHVPVVSGKKLIGILSAGDIMRAGFGTSASEIDTTLDHTTSLEVLMQSEPVTISPGTSIREAAETLAEGDFHALPVVQNDELIGMVTSTDLIKYLLAQY